MDDEVMNFADALTEQESLKPIMGIIETVMNINDENFTDKEINMLNGMLNGAFTEEIRNEAISGLLDNFKENHYNKKQIQQIIDVFNDGMNEVVDQLKPSATKRQILDIVFNIIKSLFVDAYNQYNTYDIKMPIKLDEGAHVPTYAHESDACADVYASQDALIKAHTVSTLVHTGLHIALPQGWQARLAARSSIGAKTPLRISNATPIIDTDYRGEIMLFFDNNSDSDYQIKAGDRIAQMWVEPIYRFGAEVVDALPEAAERNENGIGSTGR